MVRGRGPWTVERGPLGVCAPRFTVHAPQSTPQRPTVHASRPTPIHNFFTFPLAIRPLISKIWGISKRSVNLSGVINFARSRDRRLFPSEMFLSRERTAFMRNLLVLCACAALVQN